MKRRSFFATIAAALGVAKAKPAPEAVAEQMFRDGTHYGFVPYQGSSAIYAFAQKLVNDARMKGATNLRWHLGMGVRYEILCSAMCMDIVPWKPSYFEPKLSIFKPRNAMTFCGLNAMVHPRSIVPVGEMRLIGKYQGRLQILARETIQTNFDQA